MKPSNNRIYLLRVWLTFILVEVCTGCEKWEWRCLNGECIKGSGRCNGSPTCSDGSDENLCPTPGPTHPGTPVTCHEDQFQCDNKHCIYSGWRCDMDDDCGDNSDELNCPTHASSMMTTASIVGLSVAVVGLLVVVAGIVTMLTCARHKLLAPHRARRRRNREAIGPYAGYMADEMMFREPPPRYSSQDNIAAYTNQAFQNSPPPYYTSQPDMDNIGPTEYEPPPTYTSTQNVNTLDISYEQTNNNGRYSRHCSAGDMNNSGDSEFSLKCDQNKKSSSSLQSVTVCCTVSDNDVALSPTSRKPDSSSDSLYEGLSQEEKQILENIVQTVPSQPLDRSYSQDRVVPRQRTRQAYALTRRALGPLADNHVSMPEIPEYREPQYVQQASTSSYNNHSVSPTPTVQNTPGLNYRQNTTNKLTNKSLSTGHLSTKPRGSMGTNSHQTEGSKYESDIKLNTEQVISSSSDIHTGGETRRALSHSTPHLRVLDARNLMITTPPLDASHC